MAALPATSGGGALRPVVAAIIAQEIIMSDEGEKKDEESTTLKIKASDAMIKNLEKTMAKAHDEFEASLETAIEKMNDGPAGFSRGLAEVITAVGQLQKTTAEAVNQFGDGIGEDLAAEAAKDGALAELIGGIIGETTEAISRAAAAVAEGAMSVSGGMFDFAGKQGKTFADALENLFTGRFGEALSGFGELGTNSLDVAGLVKDAVKNATYDIVWEGLEGSFEIGREIGEGLVRIGTEVGTSVSSWMGKLSAGGFGGGGASGDWRPADRTGTVEPTGAAAGTGSIDGSAAAGDPDPGGTARKLFWRELASDPGSGETGQTSGGLAPEPVGGGLEPHGPKPQPKPGPEPDDPGGGPGDEPGGDPGGGAGGSSDDDSGGSVAGDAPDGNDDGGGAEFGDWMSVNGKIVGWVDSEGNLHDLDEPGTPELPEGAQTDTGNETDDGAAGTGGGQTSGTGESEAEDDTGGRSANEGRPADIDEGANGSGTPSVTEASFALRDLDTPAVDVRPLTAAEREALSDKLQEPKERPIDDQGFEGVSGGAPSITEDALVLRDLDTVVPDARPLSEEELDALRERINDPKERDAEDDGAGSQRTVGDTEGSWSGLGHGGDDGSFEPVDLDGNAGPGFDGSSPTGSDYGDFLGLI